MAPQRLLGLLGACLVGALLWTAMVVAAGALSARPIAVSGAGPDALIDAATREAVDHPGNLALVVIDDGRIAGSYFMSIGQPVDGDTLFQMASVSKWVTAWGVMTLVEAGKIDLDAPVSRYVRRWQLPPAGNNNDQVTVRRLLSHTAGLDDDLGYCGFAAGDALQSLEDSLTAAADACPLRSGAVAANGKAGEWRYSGGGYSLLQLLVEDVSGQPFADYMEEAVFEPLGMNRSTFRAGAPGAENLAEFFDSDGAPAEHFRYTAAAAASLYSSTSDLAAFVNAHRAAANGDVAGRGVLSEASLEVMRSPQASIDGRPHWGLGPRLYAPGRKGGLVIGHDGGNAPAVNTTVRLDTRTGDAIIALSTGGTGIASKLGTAWLRQRVDPADLQVESFNPFALLAQAWQLRRWIFGGILAIVLLAMIRLRQIVRQSRVKANPATA